ncbi:uncharacterized protein TNCV_1945731 [Trichonephila clavipes]|nr:uncharacterized protein TNCV_1945731 [Trichonephila clavipes]
MFHSISTNQKPQQFKCPTGKDSWCFFQGALSRGEVPGPHVKYVKTPLKEAHLAKIMPIYQRLASIELLQRCIRCVTQNANERLHSIIWSKCSKETSATLRRVTIAVCEFNFVSNGRILNRRLTSSYSRTGGYSQIGGTSLFSTVDHAKSTDYSSKGNPLILPADFRGCTRAFDDGPRNFEPWSSDVDLSLLTTTPHQREDASALDRFNVLRCPTRRVFRGTGLELVTRQATIRYLYNSATAAKFSNKKLFIKYLLQY